MGWTEKGEVKSGVPFDGTNFVQLYATEAYISSFLGRFDFKNSETGSVIYKVHLQDVFKNGVFFVHSNIMH